MGKISKRRKQKQHKWLVAGVVLAVIVFCVAIVLMVLAHFGILPLNHPNASESFVSNAEIKIDETEQLGYDLELQGIGSYAGLYLEDGSNDSVSDILMIRIQNTGEKDLRLARLSLTYSEFTAEFEITDLPAGRTVMVLEKNRHSYTDESYLSIALTDIVFFDQQMDVSGEIYEFSGLPGAINVRNCSGSDISGDIYVYYKYIADDELYGGITFRAKIEGGLKAGELRQVTSSHFDPGCCIILSVTAGEL